MFKKRLLSCAVVTALSFASAPTLAAGFQLNSQSATGLGRAFAGDAAIADNASVAARNPAAMALFKEANFSLGFNVIATDVRLKSGTFNDVELPSGTLSSTPIEETDGIGGTSFVPNLHLVMPINETWAWGLSAYSNFGTATEFEDDFVAPIFGGTTSIKSMNLAANVSYRLNENLSFGAGLDVIYGIGKLERNANIVGDVVDTKVVDIDATGIGLGWNVGMVYEVNEDHRFGLSYRYSPTIEAEGDKSTDDIDLPLPDMAEFSGYHRLSDKFAAHYSLQWVQWSAFDSITLQSEIGPSIDKAYEWKDAGHISVGGTYYLNNDWTLRAGYMYDIAATDELKSISIPDSNRHWLSAGFTYNINKDEDVDFGFTYLLGQDVTFDEQLIPGSDLISITDATTRANAVLIGLQYSRSF
ncbi:transporter [Photobacterium sanctipauli]|uniref:Transporter n=1 Tax=Photobacterium sanctipauli TaxID=1342794 RepID=A0A2T3NNR3_9GAMM|nr:OmpP1/FadL family transporter [Photobacterium sanctipauli]PSW17623.1 transporter [Photobacterium sanctipauli]